MLTEQRYQLILELLEKQKSITVTEVKELLDTSESTVRRDITALDKAGKLTKVFGGAIALEEQSRVTAAEPTVAQKMEVNKEEKQRRDASVLYHGQPRRNRRKGNLLRGTTGEAAEGGTPQTGRHKAREGKEKGLFLEIHTFQPACLRGMRAAVPEADMDAER